MLFISSTSIINQKTPACYTFFSTLLLFKHYVHGYFSVITVVRLVINVWALIIIILSSLFPVSLFINTYTALLQRAGRGHGDKLWTGLILDPEHGWQWSNGMPYRYLNWDSGEFSFHFNTLCCYPYNAKIGVSDIFRRCFILLPYTPCCQSAEKLISSATLQIFMEAEDFWLSRSLDSRLESQ